MRNILSELKGARSWSEVIAGVAFGAVVYGLWFWWVIEYGWKVRGYAPWS